MCPKISLSKRESCFSLFFNWLHKQNKNLSDTNILKSGILHWLHILINQKSLRQNMILAQTF